MNAELAGHGGMYGGGHGAGGSAGHGAMLAGGAAAAYGAHTVSHSHGMYGHGHGHGKFKHGKFKHGKFGKHKKMFGKHKNMFGRKWKWLTYSFNPILDEQTYIYTPESRMLSYAILIVIRIREVVRVFEVRTDGCL
jgi:hypothetical protein